MTTRKRGTTTKSILQLKLFLCFSSQNKRLTIHRKTRLFYSFLFSFKFLLQSRESAGPDGGLFGPAPVNLFGPALASFHCGFLRDHARGAKRVMLLPQLFSTVLEMNLVHDPT